MANTFLSKTLSGSPTDSNKWTWSAWVKRSKLTSEQVLFYADDGGTNYYGRIQFHDTDEISFRNKYASTNSGYAVTKAKFRDTSAWLHIVCVLDTSNSTAGDRMIIYVNGERITEFDSFAAIDQNAGSTINDGYQHRIGKGNATSGTSFFDGQMSHVHFIDGQAYAPTVFGETDATTGEWKIKTAVTATYGTNGFFILKDGNSVTDQSPNSNTFLNAGGTLTKTEDCPSNVFCNWNAANPFGGTLTNGNLTVGNSSSYDHNVQGSLGMTSGKYYWEIKMGGLNGEFGVCEQGKAGQADPQGNIGFYFFYNNGTTTGYTWNNATASGSATTSTITAFSNGMILGIAYDADNKNFYVHQNGVYVNSGDPTSGASATGALITNLYPRFGGTIVPFMGFGTSDARTNFSANFGNGFFGTTEISSAGTNASGIGRFEYNVPTGYTSLSTKGLNL